MDQLAPAITMSVFFLAVAGVLILRPITTRLGELLLTMRKERMSASGEKAELQHIVHLIEQLNSRMQLLEERQEFSERLLDARRAGILPREPELR